MKPPMQKVYGQKELKALSRRVARRKITEAVCDNGEAILAGLVFIAYFILICIFE